MSDLDKAIRARLETVRTNMTAHYAVQGDGRVDAVWNDAGELAMAIEKLLDDHKPIGIYEECGHSHRGDEPGVREFDDVGLVCDDGLMYEVCASCCDWNPLSGQTEHCVSEHDHHHGGVHCMVVYSISESLGVSGKDRSEPTPAPREPRVWRHGVHANVDPDVTEVVGGRSNVLYVREPRTQFMWRGQKSSGVGFVYGVGSLLADEGHVTEVVSPEGTP